MDEFLRFLAANPDIAKLIIVFVALLVVILVGVIIWLVIGAFKEGREISWKAIGPRPENKEQGVQAKTGPNQGEKYQSRKQPMGSSLMSSAVSDVEGEKEIYKNSNDQDFASQFIKCFQDARKVVLIGTGFYVLQLNDEVRKVLPLMSTDREVEIYAANPFSPNVETRLIEEETGTPNPNIGQAKLKDWLRHLMDEKKQEQEKLKVKKSNETIKFSLHLFPFYPTYALFIFFLSNDQHYFFYPYGYAQLGTYSPVLHYWKSNPAHGAMVKFLDDQSELIKARSVDAELAFDLHAFDRKKVNKNQLTAFAVYLIPSLESSLYDFGSKIIGYDVRTPINSLPDIKFPREVVGAAQLYGLHVTLADALYCATEQDRTLICKEVEFLAKEFQPFVLKLNVKKDFPNEKGISLVCEDKTGSLEALHHEMVARVYRRAVASNYNFDPGLADRDKDEQRAKLMIKHYHAPYILQSFKPHFSLLSAVPPLEKEIIFQKVKSEFETMVPDPCIEINSIAVMHRPDPQGHWQILQEYRLGGNS